RRKKSLKKEKGRRTPHKRSSLEKFSFCPARSIYIEVGAAYARDVPYILLEYKKSQIPSNLHGFQTLQYSNYKELARRLSLAMPGFFEAHDMVTPARMLR
ncbi:MAG: hypothetical protein L0229_04945, partial [Blastocatellia bacterium]|nr:hypothetical protein [Blastocatellia bacterium]